jgi:hypothetical protein
MDAVLCGQVLGGNVDLLIEADERKIQQQKSTSAKSIQTSYLTLNAFLVIYVFTLISRLFAVRVKNDGNFN